MQKTATGKVTTVATYASPCKMPNALQWTPEGLYVADQRYDNVYLLDEEGYVDSMLPTPGANLSGITVGDGFLWVASNGQTRFRDPRPSDTGLGYIYQLDLRTGGFVNRWRTPDGGGIHGIEWDNGKMWVTGFNPKAIMLCDPYNDLEVLQKFEVSTERLHGLARDGEGIWCAHTTDKVIIKYSVESGEEVDRLQFPDDAPAPHGLTIRDGELWYCDANMPGPPHFDTPRPAPEIGRIVVE
ncbi:MAG: hypothetical protein ACOC5M_03615 [Chloroflexota bacterium]